MRRRGYDTVKRVLDIAFAVLIGILLLPVMIAIAIAIKVEDGARVFFQQERVGRGGRRFEIAKFRTLADGPAHDPADYLISSSDPRITRVGAFLRRWSLDELPQLWNVLRGEM